MNNTYMVKQGDTLYGISNQFGVSVNDLKKENDLKSNILQIGQVLKIPINSGTNPNNTFIYTVKKGDSLYKIANLYNTTVKEIMNLNNLNSSNLQIGDKLIIPEKNTNNNLPSFTNYTVKKGDTLYNIARLNNLTIDELKRDNNITSNVLTIGQILKIRTYDEDIQECFGDDYVEDVIYIVKKGDSLYSISKKYNKTVDYIKKKNNLISNVLTIGQELKI